MPLTPNNQYAKAAYFGLRLSENTNHFFLDLSQVNTLHPAKFPMYLLRNMYNSFKIYLCFKKYYVAKYVSSQYM